jgi:hypothetical protein
VCSYGYNQSSFVEKVKNGSCVSSNKIYKPWEKCGKLMEFDKIVPYPSNVLTPMCYFYKENIILYQNDFLNRNLYLIPIVEIFLTSIFSFILLILIFFLMIIPELRELLKLKKIFGFGPKIRFIFSLRNQIIFLSFLSNFIIFFSIIDIFLDYGFLSIFLIFSTLFVFIQQVQIITLWSFFLKKSKKFSLKQLTKTQL